MASKMNELGATDGKKDRNAEDAEGLARPSRNQKKTTTNRTNYTNEKEPRITRIRADKAPAVLIWNSKAI